MNKRKITKVIIAVILPVVAVGYLLYQTAESSWVYYYSVDEFTGRLSAEDADAFCCNGGNCLVRLAGKVKEGSVSVNQEKMQLDFELAGETSLLPVRYFGTVPKNFASGREVVAEGKLGENKVFLADNILTRCESKYKVKLNNRGSEVEQ